MFDKLKKNYKNWQIKKHVSRNSIEISYEFIKLSSDRFLLEYIEKKALELADKENLKIFNVPFDVINENETVEKEKAVGRFVYLKDGFNCVDYKKMYKKLYSDIPEDELNRKTTLPRIEISEKGDVFVLLHELGHYFLYKRNQPQSEEGANSYCSEFFNNYLPPFFKRVFQIDISIRTNTSKVKFTDMENYYYLEDYKEFKKIHNVIEK